MNLGWPQIILLSTMGFSLLVEAILDGKPRTGRHSLSVRMLDLGIAVALLWWGGFFG